MKTQRRKITLLLTLIAGFAFQFTSGCAHTVLVAPKPPRTVVVEKIPLDMGLYMPDEFRNFTVSESRMGDKWNFTNLGEESAAQFRQGVRDIFRTVVLVEERPPFSRSKPFAVRAVIEPMIERFYFNIPWFKFQVYPARIVYKVTVYDLSGKILFSKSVEGVGDIKGSVGFDFAENPSRAATQAVEDGIDKGLRAIVASEEIRALGKK